MSELLPHWDFTVIYPGLETPEFAAGFQAAVAAVDALTALLDMHAVGRRDPAPLDEPTLQAFEQVLTAYNATLTQTHTLGAYIQGFLTTDSRDTVAQARWSEFQRQTMRLTLLTTRLTAWIGSLDVEALLARSALARAHEYALRRAQVQAAHQMSPAEEALATELRLTGGAAWAKLYHSFASQLAVTVELEGVSQRLPMSAIRNLAYEPEREVRRRAYEAELCAWQGAVVPIAAALNSLKGELLTLARRRGWESPLELALFENAIDRETLDALFTAARESFPDFRRYLQVKARALGLPVLAWYDLFAPVGTAETSWTFAEASAFVVEQFGTFSPRLRDLAARAFQERWIDAEPRPGKRDGAFCMWLRGGESRILSNFKPAYGGMGTLAHELGHAYHNLVRAECTYLQRQTPMTLAETASIFCETLVREAALRQSTPQEQRVILEASLQSACQQVVDITSRFLFEQAVFEQRQQRELSADELNQLMLAAQREAYGEALDPQQLHPYMWAAKPHYYDSTFYNFPYLFGLLFGLGLYARYQEDPTGFKAGYDDLLAATGQADAATLAARFGINLRAPAFWRASLDVIRANIDRFEALVNTL